MIVWDTHMVVPAAVVWAVFGLIPLTFGLLLWLDYKPKKKVK